MTLLSRAIGGLMAIVAAAPGVVSLVAWWLGGWRMAQFGPDGIPMGPITAFLFVILGLALAVLMRWPESRAAGQAGLVASATALVVSSLAAAQAWNYFALPWDRWLLGGGTLAGSMPLGRMSPLTMIAFLFTSVGFLGQLVPFRDRSALRRTAVIANGLGFVIGAGVVASFAAGVPPYYGGRTSPIAVLTALAFAALNLGLLLRADIGSRRPWRRLAVPVEPARFYRMELLGLGMMAGLTAFAGLFYLREEQTSARLEAHRQLNAIANLKAAQIRGWREERMGEARFLLHTRAVAQDVAALLARPGGRDERAQMVDWLEPIRGGRRYHSVLLFDANARLLISIPDSLTPASSAPPPLLREALASRDVIFSDLYRDRESGSLHIDILVPIRPPTREKQASAVIVLRLDPNEFLFPLVHSWPVPSETAETLLVRREGNDLVYLSELRYEPGGLLTHRRSMDEPFLVSAPGLRGDVSVREGLDYRGTAVVATSRPIPGSPWVMVVKIDQREVYEPVRREAWQTGALVGLLMLVLILGGGFFSWQRQSAALSRALRAEKDRNLMGERLAILTQYANDVILLTNEQGQIIDANEKAVKTYGYTLEELRALPPGGLRTPDSADDLARHIETISSPEGGVFEALHRRKDGSVLPVEVSGRNVVVGGQRLLLAVGRDITERKKHEAEISRLNHLYAAHSQVNQAIVHADAPQALLHEVCRTLVQAGGFSMVWFGRPHPATGLIEAVANFGDASGYLRDIRVTPDEIPEWRSLVGTVTRENGTIVCSDLLVPPANRPWQEAARDAGFRAAISLPVRMHGKTGGTLTAYAAESGFFGAREIGLIEEAAFDLGFGLASLDREERRERAEVALSKSEERLRLALRAGRQGLYDLNIETGEAATSPEYAAMLGYDPASFHETHASWLDRVHPDDRAKVAKAYADYIRGLRTEYRVEFRQQTQTGDWKWLLFMGDIVERTKDGQPLRMLGTHTDVTELKQAQEAVAASEVRYRRLFESAKDGILILDAVTGMVVDVNPFLIDLLGYSREAFLGKAVWDLGFFRDIVANQDGFAELQNQEYVRYEDKPLETADGRSIEVEFVSNVYLVEDQRVIQCNIRDITDRKRAEIALRASLNEKEALLKEVHHRVKNNLQVIASLLRLETSRTSEPATKLVLKDMQGRIRSMALLHETLYRSGNFARVNLADYLRQLATQLFRIQNAESSRVHLVIDLVAVHVEIDQAIPCGLIVNELLANSLKYAFVDGRSGEVRLTLSQGPDGQVRINVVDDGVGLPEDFEARRGRSLGLQLVSDLARQLGGALAIEPGPGASFTVAFLPHDSTGDRRAPA